MAITLYKFFCRRYTQYFTKRIYYSYEFSSKYDFLKFCIKYVHTPLGLTSTSQFGFCVAVILLNYHLPIIYYKL